MSGPNLPLLAALSLVSAALLTGLVRGWALRTGLLDVPNQRSSHRRITPRGGGLAVTVTVLTAALCLAARGALPVRLAIAWAAGGGLVACVGFLDDRLHLSARVRFAAHLLAAALAVWANQGVPPMPMHDGVVGLGMAGAVLGVIAIVWSVNLFNFMDGIDGLAGSQAVFVSGAACLIGIQGADPDASTVLLGCLAAASAGFLLWNLPPARIFMGDVGSGFLGFALALGALSTSGEGMLNLWTWIILHGAFLADSMVTLFVRLWRGERVYQAHREHAYQRLSRRWRSHAKVSLLYAGVNVCWLLPLSLAAAFRPSLGLPLTVLAVAPLCLGALLSGAGRPEARDDPA